MIKQHLLYRYLSIFCIAYVGIATLGETGSYERAFMSMLSDTAMWFLGMFSVISVYGDKDKNNWTQSGELYESLWLFS